MTNLTDINKKHTPMQIMQMVPWDKVKNCIIVYTIPVDGDSTDEQAMLHVSDMTWRDRMWLEGMIRVQSIADLLGL